MYASLKSDKSKSLGELKRFTAFEAANEPRHRWYLFKEGFSKDLVSQAIADRNIETGAVVVDPFCGSGTTTLTAASHGISSAGIEVNPFLKFVSETKITNCTLDSFDKTADKALEGTKSRQHSRFEEFSTFSERADISINSGKWLFNSPVLRAFEGGWKEIEGSRSAKGLLRLCLLNAAMDVSNAVKDGKCLRYKKDWKRFEYNKDDFREALEKRIQDVREDIADNLPDATASSIQNNDSRSIHFDKKFDLCVTSPPYLNSFDYTDIYRPELFLGGFIDSLEGLRQLRLKTVRSHVQVKWENPTHNAFGYNYAETMKEIEETKDVLWNKRIPLMIQAYFEDMQKTLLNLKQKAKPDATVWIIVSTSAYAGIEIPVDLIIADIAHKNGWFLREVSVLRYMRRVAPQQWDRLSERKLGNAPYLRESVIILDNQKF